MGLFRLLSERRWLRQGNHAAAFGEYRDARRHFSQVLAVSDRAAHLWKAALGIAKASAGLSDPNAVLEALNHPRGVAIAQWPNAEAAEVALLAAKAYMELERVEEALAQLVDSVRRCGRQLGWDDDAPMSAELAAELVATHPDDVGAERLAMAAIGLAEIYAVTWQFRAALAWLRAAAAGVGRTMGSRSSHLLMRVHNSAMMLDERSHDPDEAELLLDGLPLEELVERAWAAREAGQVPVGETPAEIVYAFGLVRMDEALVSSRQADLILEDLAAAIVELDRVGAVRLAATARFALARLHCEKAQAEASIAFRALSFERQQELRDASDLLRFDVPSVVKPLLIAAIDVFNANRPDMDALLAGSLVILADFLRSEGEISLAERVAHQAIALVPGEPSSLWRACATLSHLLQDRGALNAAVFWAKMGLTGLCIVSRMTSTAFSMEEAGPAAVEDHAALLINLLRGQGRVGEAGEIATIVKQGLDRQAVPWTAEEARARENLCSGLKAVDPNAPLDFADDAPARLCIAAVERDLPDRDLPEVADFELGAGVAVLSIAPSGNGVELRLRTDDLTWEGTVASVFSPRYPLSFAVDSLLQSFSSPPDEPHVPWPEPFARSWVEEISENILGAVPPFEAHTLLLRTAGIFRYLPFAPMGVGPPLVDLLPLLSCPTATVRARPITRPPRFALFAVGAEALAGAAEEAQIFERLAGPGGLLGRSGPEADRAGLEVLLASDATILHLATHGVAHAAEPGQGSLLLSDASFMTLGELAAHDLSSFELITLAACASGLPGGASQETPVDLLHRAGAPRVLTALWPVDDAATVLLMEHFYRALFGSGPASPAVALRTAQLATRKVYPHPYFWAAFHLSAMPD
jgi:hypothetical protein